MSAEIIDLDKKREEKAAADALELARQGVELAGGGGGNWVALIAAGMILGAVVWWVIEQTKSSANKKNASGRD